MWLKTLDNSGNPSLVNLDKVHRVKIFLDHNSKLSVIAYINDGSYREEYSQGYNKITLYMGSVEECQAYMKWLHAEIDICGKVLEYQQK